MLVVSVVVDVIVVKQMLIIVVNTLQIYFRVITLMGSQTFLLGGPLKL